MSKMRAFELLPFLALIAAVGMLWSATLASAGFGFPDLFGKWSFGGAAPAYELGTTKTVTNAYLPFGDQAVPSGFSLPFGDQAEPSGFSLPFGDNILFRSPVKSGDRTSGRS